MVPKKAVITCAGKGSRMAHLSSYMPKALFPIFRRVDGKTVAEPVIESILDSLAEAGIADFCFVVRDHKELLASYLSKREVDFVTQPEPKGFGDAVLRAREFATEAPVFVHADDGVLTGGYKEAAALYEQKNPDIVLLLREVSNPRRYGIVTAEQDGVFMDHKIYRIKEVEEKPQDPKSNLALSAVYVFSPKIFRALEDTPPMDGKEHELTSGISKIISEGGTAYGILLEKEKWLNVGDPESYHTALAYSYDNY
jgi:dTDP-glucose pyrophosphorylase